MTVLDLLFSSNPVERVDLDDLNSADWNELVRLLRSHRIGALMSWNIRRAGSSDAAHIPMEIRDYIAAARKQTALRILQIQAALLEIEDILTGSGIPYAFVKGAYLTWHVYPERSIRFARDIDLVVPNGRAIEAWQCLQDHGFTRWNGAPGTAEEWLDRLHHLPHLIVPGSSLLLEVHARLFAPAYILDLSEDAGYWERRQSVKVSNKPIFVNSPTDCLLHIIHHGVVCDRFRCGPVFVSDVYFLIEKGEIEWDTFWFLANKLGLVRAALLSFAIVERYFGTLEISGRPRPNSSAAHIRKRVDVSLQLMLRDVEKHKLHGVLEQWEASGTGIERLRYILSKLFRPGKGALTRLGRPGTLFQWATLYPRYWIFLWKERIEVLRHEESDSRITYEKDLIADLDRWLQ